MPFVDMNTFWCDWQVLSGDNTAFDEYTTFKNGLLMNDGITLCYNMYDLCQYNNTNRYELFKYYEYLDPDIYGEYQFYKYTNDSNIFDYRTFWQNAPSYLGTCSPPILPKIAVFGRINTEAFTSTDDGLTYNNTTIQIPVPLPPSSPNNMYVQRNSFTMDGNGIFMGTAVDTVNPSNSYLYYFNFNHEEWVQVHNFTGIKPVSDLLYIPDNSPIHPEMLYRVGNTNLFNLSRSLDLGNTFSHQTLSPTFIPEKIGYDDILGVMVIGGYGTETERFLVSYDYGGTFQYCNSHPAVPQSQFLTSLNWYKDAGAHISAPGLWVATFAEGGGNDGEIWTSGDGLNWTQDIYGVGDSDFFDSAYDKDTNTIIFSNNLYTSTYTFINGVFNLISQPSNNFWNIFKVPNTSRFIWYSSNAGLNETAISDDFGVSYSIPSQGVDFQGAQVIVGY